VSDATSDRLKVYADRVSTVARNVSPLLLALSVQKPSGLFLNHPGSKEPVERNSTRINARLSLPATLIQTSIGPTCDCMPTLQTLWRIPESAATDHPSTSQAISKTFLVRILSTVFITASLAYLNDSRVKLSSTESK